jgi:hypothetical protein
VGNTDGALNNGQSTINNGTTNADNGFGQANFSINSLSVTNIKTTSAILHWKVNSPYDYVINWGTDPRNLTKTQQYYSQNTSITMVLNHLPAGKKIYISITPTINGVTGISQTANFKTKPQSPIIVLFYTIFILGLIGLAIVWLLKRRRSKDTYDTPVYQEIPQAELHPQESPEAYENRVNWWTANGDNIANHDRHIESDEGVKDMFAGLDAESLPKPHEPPRITNTHEHYVAPPTHDETPQPVPSKAPEPEPPVEELPPPVPMQSDDSGTLKIPHDDSDIPSQHSESSGEGEFASGESITLSHENKPKHKPGSSKH